MIATAMGAVSTSAGTKPNRWESERVKAQVRVNP